MSTSSYRIVPQTPVQAVSNTELDGEDDDDAHAIVHPSDRRIRYIHFILGCAVLLPWNVMITASPYFISRLAGSSLGRTFSSYLSSSFTAANFVFLAHATATSEQSSSALWVLTSILALSLLTALLMLSTFIQSSPGFFFSFVLLNGIAQATAGSYLQTAVVAIASLFGPSAIQALMSGQAAVAVIVSGVQVVTATASVWGVPKAAIATFEIDGETEKRSAVVFFGLSTAFLVATVVAHRWFVTLPVYNAVVAVQSRQKSVTDLTNPDEQEGLVSTGRGRDSTDRKHRILSVAKANITYEIALAFVFVVTLSVFPPITISIYPTNPRTHPFLFSAIHFLVFNIGDFLGRYACAIPRIRIWSAKKLLVLSLTRSLFIPLFLMCNVQRPSSSPPTSPFINSDVLFMLILLLFGLSNGYVSSMCMMSAPSLEHNPRLKNRRENVDVAATVASFCLVGGLAVGSVASFAVRGAVCDCNPFRE